MTIQESFNDFLNSPGPSNFRGRGRGRGRGGGGGPGESHGRGGGGGRGRGRGGFPGQGQTLDGAPPQHRRVFKTDYSSVGFDYTKIEKQGYVNMAGYNVSPFNPKASYSGQSTPRGRGGGGGRGFGPPRGIGLGGGGPARGAHSGSATPVTGLGYHGAQESKARTTLTAMDVLGISKRTQKDGYWGGGMAPLFIKAGELFKDGEVDIVTLEEDSIEVEKIALSDPAAPQMTDLRDDAEVEAMVLDKSVGPSRKPSPLPAFTEASFEITALASSATEEVEVIHWSQPAAYLPPTVRGNPFRQPVAPNPNNLSAKAASFVPKISPPTESAATLPTFIAPLPPKGAVSTNPISQRSPVTAPEVPVNPSPPPAADSDLFFVDTIGSQATTSDRPVYDAPTAPPIGTAAPADDSASEEEEILFAPRQFADPAPLAVPIAAPPPPEVDESLQIISRVYLNPHKASRAEKKAAKREKRKGRREKQNGKKKDKPARKREEELSGSDIDWGTDGVPAGVFNVPDASSDQDVPMGREERDVEILRDYLAGTLLNAKSEEEDRREEMEAAAATAAAKRGSAPVDPPQSKASASKPSEKKKGKQKAEIVVDEDGEDDEGDWVSDSGSNGDGESGSESDSSDIGDLNEMLEFDSDEEEQFFTGKQSWGKGGDDWFINSMDVALNGGAMESLPRKDRKALFKSIEEGDFGDDWPMAPVKKGRKNKLKDVPPALQNQWEKDRQKKALRKEQRHLQRMFEELNPQLGSGKKSRKKGKGNNKIRDVSLAHLLPGSAHEVADLFDVSSSEDEGAGGKMSKMRNLLLPPTMADLDVQIRDFLDDEGRTTFSLPPMDKDGRAKVHMLAEAFSLKSKSKGSGTGRFTILLKTKHSGVNINERKISRIVAASAQPGGAFYKNMFGGAKGKRGGGEGGKGVGDRGSSARAKEGDLVGEGADKIGQDNVGHKLLSKMGWAEGDKIGKTEGGLDAPIIAIVKYTKRGLGH